MTTAFTGFPQEGIDFLKDLKKNNNRDWFLAHKKVFDGSVKAPMVLLVEGVNAALAKFAPDYRNEPAKAIGRMNRDARFSKDKSPYKTTISAVFPFQGKEKQAAAGFWFSVGADEIEVVAGSYMPGPPELASLRACLADKHAAFRKVLAAKGLADLMGSLQGEQLQRVPRDYPANHPAGDLLRYKQFFLSSRLAPAVATTPKLLNELVARFRAATPFIAFLDEALSAG